MSMTRKEAIAYFEARGNYNPNDGTNREAEKMALTALRGPTREMDDEFGKYKKFKEYFDDLYGKGLEVENWHMNGETIPFDDFYESACEYAEL